MRFFQEQMESNDLLMGVGWSYIFLPAKLLLANIVRQSEQFSFVHTSLFTGQGMFPCVLSYSVMFRISGCVSRPTWLESQLIRKPRPRLLLRTSTNCRWQLYKDCLCITSGRTGRVQHMLKMVDKVSSFWLKMTLPWYHPRSNRHCGTCFSGHI